MIHLKNNKYSPKDSQKLLLQARELSKPFDSIIRDTRVSSKFIEFDISIKKESLESLLQNLRDIGVLINAKHVVETEIEKEKAIGEGISYFNNERFWECHEVLEGVWKKCYAEEKTLVQGIILVAAALVHFQKYENEICISILKRALEKLEKSSGNYHKINIDKLKSKINEIISSGIIDSFAI